MNFFGHAIVATWTENEPAFVLGSMLPDFATMIGARVPRVSGDGLERGVAFHHETDHVFHEAPTFKALMAEARAALREASLPRPSALAVGHIGIEILLDSILASDANGIAGYLAALAEASPSKLGAYIDWGAPEFAPRFESLRTVLIARGIAAGDGGPLAAAARVTRALASRPRFRLDPEGERIVRAWAETAAPVVRERADALISEILAGLPRTNRPSHRIAN